MKIIPLIIICILMFLLSGCTESVLESNNAEILNYEIKEFNHKIVIETELSGNTDLGVALSKDNSEICYYDVEERKLKDGSEVINLEMCNNEYETPEDGTYSIIVYIDDEIYLKEDISSIGPLLSITSMEVTDSSTYDSLKEKYYTEFIISYENIGDLPAYVSQIYLDSGRDTSYKGVSETSQYIGVGESTTLSGAIYLETYYYVDGSVTAYLLDSEGNPLGLSYYWNE